MVDPDAHYELARRRLGLDPAADAAAAQLLGELLKKKDVIEPASLRPAFAGRDVFVLGTGPDCFNAALHLPHLAPVVVAGSAVAPALAARVEPILIVSDLDGNGDAHRAYSKDGIPIAVHAHGDNVDLLRALVPRLEGPLFGTYQAPPAGGAGFGLHRFGGFTDGDRACFIAAAMGARSLTLAGWDLDKPVPATPRKRAKLEIARELLRDVPVPVRLLGA